MDGANLTKNPQSQQTEVERLKRLRPDIPEEIYDIEASEEMQLQWDDFQAGLL